MEWLTSGLRRDVCVLLYGDQHRAQRLKSAIEARYDRRIEPERFYGALDALESKGFLDKRVEGLEDVYALTGAGRRGVEAHAEWLCERVGAGADGRGGENGTGESEARESEWTDEGGTES